MKMTAQDNLRSILARLKTLTVSLAMPVAAMCLLGIVFASSPAYAEETACASVKIEIKQELTPGATGLGLGIRAAKKGGAQAAKEGTAYRAINPAYAEST